MTKQQAREVDEPGADELARQTEVPAQAPDGSDPNQAVAQPDAEQLNVAEEAGEEAAAADHGDEPTVAALQAEVEKLKAALAQSSDAVLRARADSENIRRRAERDVENAHKFGQEKFASALLPVLDSLELGLSAAQDDQVDIASVREGLELTLKMFAQAAEKFALEPVDPVGGMFDPEFHQAISMQDSDASASGTVLTVVQKGYLLHGRVIRPAMVIVAK